MNRGKVHLADNIKQFACINSEKQWPEARALWYTEVQIQTLRSGGVLWLVYVLNRSFQQTFVGENCVTSQKNVCVGGYQEFSELSPHFSWGGIVGWFLGGRVVSCWCALKVCALGFLRHSHQTSLAISVYFSISARMIECNMIHRIAECHPLILFSICSQIELA